MNTEAMTTVIREKCDLQLTAVWILVVPKLRDPLEVDKTRKYGPLFGLLHPTVMDMKASPVSSMAVMQLELCGGLHGLADLARGIQVPRAQGSPPEVYAGGR